MHLFALSLQNRLGVFFYSLSQKIRKGDCIMNNTEKTMDKIVALCKNRGFVFPGSEIYGGLANTWDYGPLGA